MKKRFIGISVLAAALTLSTGITAFAGWKQDTNGWYYERDNGTWVPCGWFTDPADGAMYYMDPDGYMMSGTTVEGFKLGDDGRRIEKTAEDLAREAERKKRIASRPSPAKEQAAADLAADAAKKGVASTTTTRLAYQAEMKVFMDNLFIDTQKKLTAAGSTATRPSTTEDNLEVTYRFSAAAGPVVEASLWKMSNPDNSNYKPNALDLEYNRNYVTEAADIEKFDSLFQRMCVAALGETEGKAVTDAYYAEIAAGTTNFERNGNTDAGNYYTMKYNSGKAFIEVTCSEIVPVDPNAETTTENTTTEENASAETTEEVVTSSVIVAGQGSTAAEETTEAAAEETTEAVEETTEAAAE